MASVLICIVLLGEIDDRIDWQMRPPTVAERERVLAARREELAATRRVRLKVTKFDILPQTPEQADPRWHRPSPGTELREGSPTTVYYVVDPQAPLRTIDQMNMSIVSILRTRETGRPLRLFVVVFGVTRPGTGHADLCALLVPAWRREQLADDALATQPGDRVCRELRNTRADESCTLPPSHAELSAGSGVTLTVVRAAEAWHEHPRMRSILASWMRFKKESKGQTKGRPDLQRLAPTLLFRWFAPQLLLHLGVSRAIYLDADSCALTDLNPLYQLPLSARYPLGFVRRQRHDDVYTRDGYNVTNPIGMQYGFYSDDAQATNAGVYVLDTAHMCRAGHLRLLDRLARQIVDDGSRLFGRNVGFDQPLSMIALAANTTYADPRWNCRRPWSALRYCFLLHTRNCADGVRSGLPDGTWLQNRSFFRRPP